MPLVTLSNNWQVGVAKQVNETTIPTTADYTFPVFGGRPQPVESINRIAVTDASAQQGDPYKAGDTHWNTDGLVVPGFAAPLGRLLSMLWPTDTVTGAGPFTHTFSALGSTTAWFAWFSDPVSGALDETFEAGLCSGLNFSADQGGGPLRVGINMVGKRPTVAAWTIGGQAAMADGYFTAKGASLKYEVDSATPAVETNIQDFAIDVPFPVTPVPTADSTSVALLNKGPGAPAMTMTLIHDDWEAYRATYYGAVGGSTPSTTIVTGSVELNFVHSVQAGWSFKLTVPKVALRATPPQPDAGGATLTVPIVGEIFAPAAGERVAPVLINAVSTSYA